MGQRDANKYSVTKEFSDQNIWKPHRKQVRRSFCNTGHLRTVIC